MAKRAGSRTDPGARPGLTGALFFGSAGLAILLANGLARRMTRPMQRLTEAMQEIAVGGRFKPVEADQR